MAERSLFKFYKSYFDVASELLDSDRLLFYDAIMNKQFNGTEPSLTGMSKFAYISQKHSIDAQVKGWEDKIGFILGTPIEPPTIPPIEHPIEPPFIDPSIQEEEKEEVKEEVKVKEKKKTKVFIPPELIDVENYFIENGYKKDSAQRFFNSYSVAEWYDSRGNKINNWKQKANMVWFKDENKISQNGQRERTNNTSTGNNGLQTTRDPRIKIH